MPVNPSTPGLLQTRPSSVLSDLPRRFPADPASGGTDRAVPQESSPPRLRPHPHSGVPPAAQTTGTNERSPEEQILAPGCLTAFNPAWSQPRPSLSTVVSTKAHPPFIDKSVVQDLQIILRRIISEVL